MAELKRSFTGGKMNKDLDERFVPKNQYRHGVNIQVRQSDTDSAGTVQNLQGNVSFGACYTEAWMTGRYNTSTWQIVSAFSTEGGSDAGTYQWQDNAIGEVTARYPVCIGSVADEKSNNAYFFFTNTHEPLEHLFSYEIDRLFIDSIVEQNTNGTTSNVVKDHWATTGRLVDLLPICGKDGEDGEDCFDNTNGYANDSELNAGLTELRVSDGRKFRVGMTMHGYTDTDGVSVDLLQSDSGVSPKIKAINKVL